jgi:hypothetical protein
MWTVSSKWAAALAASHIAVAVAEVWPSIAAGVASATLQVLSGDVKVDYTQAIRRSCQLVVEDPTGALTPRTASDLLAPYGPELHLSRGIIYADGTKELAPLGVFRLSQSQPHSGSDGTTLTLTGYDRARTVQRAALADFYVIAAGTNIATAIKALIQQQVPALVDGLFNLIPTTVTTPAMTLEPGADPWAAAQTLAQAAGCDLYFDQVGRATMTPVVNPQTAAPVASYVEGTGGLLLSSDPLLDDTDGYNQVVVMSSNSNANPPVMAVATDTNPNSPTYNGGPYGTVTAPVIRSDLATTSAVALSMAQAQLYRGFGVTQKVSFEGIVNPALDASDVITIKRAAVRLSGNYVLDQLTIPLGADQPMPGITRQVAFL